MKSVAHITFSSRRLTRGSIRLREEHRCPVVMEGEKIVGLITERNYAPKNRPHGAVVKRYAGARHHDPVGDVCQVW